MEQLQTIWQQLADQRKKGRAVYLVSIVAYALAVVLVVLKFRNAAMVLGFVGVLVYLLAGRRMNKAYSSGITRANVLHGLCAPLQQVEFTPGKGGMTEEELDALQLLPVHHTKGENGLLCNNAIRAQYEGFAVNACELTLHYPYMAGDKQRFEFMSGSLFTAPALPVTEQQGDWLLLHRDMLREDAQLQFTERCGYHLIAVEESIGLHFYVYARTPDAQLPDHLRNQIAALIKNVPAAGAVRLAPGVAAVYLHKRLYTFRTPLRDQLTVEQLGTSPLGERDAVLALLRYWAQVH